MLQFEGCSILIFFQLYFYHFCYKKLDWLLIRFLNWIWVQDKKQNLIRMSPYIYRTVCHDEENRARICKRLWSPRVDSRESIPCANVASRAGTTNRVVVPARQAVN